MKKGLIISCLVFSFLFIGTIPAMAQNIEHREVTYTANGVQMKGYLAYDKNITEKRPGVLVVHEWWGHDEYVRNRAVMLANMGYTALALDMYGEGRKADHPQEAGKFASALMENFDVMEARFLAAKEFLKKQDTVDPQKIAAIGYCFGGGVVLNMARQGADLKGVASFHGNLTAIKPARKNEVKAKILVLNGEGDNMITSEQIAAFKQEMKAANADFLFINYPDAKHSFTNPRADDLAEKFNMPIGYNEAADQASWEELKRFLGEIFRSR